MLRTRRPLLALLLLGVLLAGGYLLSAVRADPGSDADRAAGSAATASPPTTGRPPTSPPTASPPTTGRPPAAAPGATGSTTRLATVPASELPAEARRTLRLIDSGGPFPYDRDGSIFGNIERLLPPHPRGWYREFTVPTPGEPDRGARRIVAGEDGVRYYTADHYESFAVVEPDR